MFAIVYCIHSNRSKIINIKQPINMQTAEFKEHNRGISGGLERSCMKLKDMVLKSLFRWSGRDKGLYLLPFLGFVDSGRIG